MSTYSGMGSVPSCVIQSCSLTHWSDGRFSGSLVSMRKIKCRRPGSIVTVTPFIVGDDGGDDKAAMLKESLLLAVRRVEEEADAASVMVVVPAVEGDGLLREMISFGNLSSSLRTLRLSSSCVVAFHGGWP